MPLSNRTGQLGRILPPTHVPSMLTLSTRCTLPTGDYQSSDMTTHCSLPMGGPTEGWPQRGVRCASVRCAGLDCGGRERASSPCFFFLGVDIRVTQCTGALCVVRCKRDGGPVSRGSYCARHNFQTGIIERTGRGGSGSGYGTSDPENWQLVLAIGDRLEGMGTGSAFGSSLEWPSGIGVLTSLSCQ